MIVDPVLATVVAGGAAVVAVAGIAGAACCEYQKMSSNLDHAERMREAAERERDEAQYARQTALAEMVERMVEEEELRRQQEERCANERLHQMQQGKHDYSFDIAICGCSGVGKSALNNALRGKSFGDEDYAPVDEGLQGTQHTTRYNWHGLSSNLWDFPGGNTTDHPAETYFLDKCIDEFDVILVAFHGRIRELEERVLQEAKCKGVVSRIAYVYTKVDVDIDSKMRRKSMTVEQAEDELRRTVTSEFNKMLQRIGVTISVPLFFVSCIEADQSFSQYDTEELRNLLKAAAESDLRLE